MSTVEWLPTDPPRPAPALMTMEEAATYLRLTEGGRDIADSRASLDYLVSVGRLRPCRVGRHNRFSRAELDRFIQQQTEQYASRYSSVPNRATTERVSTGGGESL